MYQQFVKFSLFLLLCGILSAVVYFNIRTDWIAFYRAESLYKDKKFEEAIGYYEKAVKGGLSNKVLFFHLGDAYTAEENFDKAIHTYKKYLQMDPKDREARLRLARSYSYAGNLDESTKEYKKAMNDE